MSAETVSLDEPVREVRLEIGIHTAAPLMAMLLAAVLTIRLQVGLLVNL